MSPIQEPMLFARGRGNHCVFHVELHLREPCAQMLEAQSRKVLIKRNGLRQRAPGSSSGHGIVEAFDRQKHLAFVRMHSDAVRIELRWMTRRRRIFCAVIQHRN